MCVCLSVRERQGVVSEFALMCVYVWALIVHVHMSIGTPCMELGVCQEYCMRAVSGECMEWIS